MHIRRDLAAAQIDHVDWRLRAACLLPALVEPELEIAACKPITFEGLQCETFRFKETQLVTELGHLRDITGPVADVTAFQGHL